MKKRITLVLVTLIACALAAGCKNEAPTTEAPAAAPAAAPEAAPAAQPAMGKSGTVTETMNAAGYTYVQVDTGSEKIWAAAPEFPVSVGDAVVVPEGMPMENYHSKTLERDFDVVYFVDRVMTGGAEAAMGSEAMPEGHPPVAVESAETSGVDLSDIAKADKTVEEIFAAKADLEGQEVSVRGKVVKFNQQIMGKNWIHLQDGTGGEGTNDLTITTAAAAQVGDTVLVKGALSLDKDFGYGYKYDVIVEDAAITVE